MTIQKSARLSVSTWSLHRTLGRAPIYGPGEDGQQAMNGEGAISLLELPARIAERGFKSLEICHFHLPSREPAYLAKVRSALDEAEVELFSFLIDGGDITHPQYAERDLAWIESWFDVAAELGAKNARVSAGKAEPSQQTLSLSSHNLKRLAAQAQAHGIRLMTENWHALLSNPEAVLFILDSLEGELGLCADFGNWSGPMKYKNLAAILPYADSCHAKCRFTGPNEMARDDFRRCLDLSHAAGFTGPYTLIYDGPSSNEWQGLKLEAEMVRPYLS